MFFKCILIVKAMQPGQMSFRQVCYNLKSGVPERRQSKGEGAAFSKGTFNTSVQSIIINIVF